MNWYKKAQQSLLFYPYGTEPSQQNDRVQPISIDSETGENVYQCNMCKNLVLESDIGAWYKSIEGGKNLQLPKYDKRRISQGLTEIAQYLSSFLPQLYNYIQKNNLEEKRNKYYDYGFRTELSKWEIQIPQLQNIVNNYPELVDICAYNSDKYGISNLCMILNRSEINGEKLLNLEEFIKNPTEKIDFFSSHSGQEFEISYLVPVCQECSETMDKCEFCDKIILPNDDKIVTTWNSSAYICWNCIENGYAEICQECGKADSLEDLYVDEEGMSTCEHCYKEKNSDVISWAEEKISNLNIPVGKNLPLSEKVLTNLSRFLKSYISKYGENKINTQEWGRISHVAKKRKLPQGALDYLNYLEKSWNISDDTKITSAQLIRDIDNNLKAQKYMKEQYPDIKSYQDLPYDIEVLPNYNQSKQGFTIAITPSDKFFDYAEKKYPDIHSVWDKMNQTPHHNGYLAYARCAYEMGNNLVVNNLQRDADFDNYIKKVNIHKWENTPQGQAAKWIDNTTKNWDVFLLNIIKALSISENINSYLSTFNQQKNKWGNLPIHKSKKTYEETPQNMGFQLSDIDNPNLIEDGNYWREKMYQIANDVGKNWYKKAQQNRKKYLENLAKKEFGTTSSIGLAGYLLTDGTMLNFSKGGYQRDYDHRQISGIGEGEAIKEQYTLGMYEFMKETKAIRVNAHSESLGLHIMSPPTIEQLSIINKNLKYFPEFYIDIQDSKGDIIEHKEYNYPNSREVTAYWFNIQNIYTGDITNEYKYPTEIYRAYNEYYGSDTSPEDIDTMRDNEVSMAASMSLPGGKEEFMELVKRHNNELV